MTSPTLEAHSSSSLMSFQLSILSTCLSYLCFIYIHINHSRSRMQIPLSKSVALSMMVACLLAFVEPSALVSISIALDYTYVDIYISMDSYTPTSNTSSSFASFCTTCSSINHCSTPSSSSNSSMLTRSIDVALGPTCTLEL